MTTTAGHHHDPLRQARLELSELRAGIEGLADPHQREQLALTIRNLSAFRHAATFQATQDRAALDPEHGSWLATILRSWSPRQLAGLRPGTSGPPFWAASCAARRLQRWAVGGGRQGSSVVTYFGDRDGLLAAVAERFADALIVRLEAAIAGPGARRRLHGAIATYVEFIEEDLGLDPFLTEHASVHSPALLGVIDRVATTAASAIDDALRQQEASGAAEPWAHGIVGIVHMAGAPSCWPSSRSRSSPWPTCGA